MLNIGANKGYNLAEFLQRYTDTNITNIRWHRLMMKRATPPCGLQCCGVCIICHRPRIAQRAAAERVQLHAFELQPSNQQLLQQLTSLTGTPIEVHGVAMSNYTGSVYTRDSGRPGYESVAATRTRKARSIERKVTTVDAFMAERSLKRIQLVAHSSSLPTLPRTPARPPHAPTQALAYSNPPFARPTTAPSPPPSLGLDHGPLDTRPHTPGASLLR